MQLTKYYKRNSILLNALFLICLLRLFLPYMVFSGSDLEGLSMKYLYLYNSIDVYNAKEWMTTLPYFPYVTSIYLFAGKIADAININFVFILKYIALIFEFLIAGMIVSFYAKKNYDLKKLIIILSIFLINPITAYVTSFLGFFETLWIFFLLLCVFLFEFEKEKIQNIYIPIFLAISIAIKPVSIFFVFYFFYRNTSKILFLIIFFSSILLLNLFFIVANFSNPNQIIELFSIINHKFIVGTQTGEFGFSEIEKLYNNNINFLNFTIFKIFKIFLFFLIFYIYLISLHSKKIKSYEFIFSIFFVVLLFNDNLHSNYLYWIFPFAFLINYKKALLAGILLSIVCLTSTLIYYENYNMLSFLNVFGFLKSDITDIDPPNNSNTKIIFDILIYYTSLTILFDKKIFKKIQPNNWNYILIIKKIFLRSFNVNRVRINEIKFFYKKTQYNLYLIIMFIPCFLLFGELKNTIIKNNKNTSQFSLPPSINFHETHGNKIQFTTNLKIDNEKNLDLIFVTGYFSTVYINSEKVLSSRNILNHIYNVPYHYRNKEKIYPVRKININNQLIKGNNEIKIISTIPHPIKEKFGLILFLLDQGSIFKSTEDLIWRVNVNNKNVNYKIEKNIKNNYYYSRYEKLLDNYLSISPKMKILNYETLLNNKVITPFNFMFFIFIIIFLINIIYYKIAKNV